jgi:serine/threonine-protein kinase
LRIVAVVGLTAAILYTAISLPGWFRGHALFGSVAADGAFVGLDLFATASLVAVLFGRRPLSYARLRSIESLLFGLYMALYAVFIFVPTRGGALAKYEPLSWAGGWAVGSALSLPGFAAVVTYGLFIPNSWRRCAIAAGSMALLPLVVSAAAIGLMGRNFDGGLLAAYFGTMTIWMVLAVALAVSGAHRITALRREAFEARRLGQYELGRRLGAGGMGEVYLAEHRLLRRPCAVKLIRPERCGDPVSLSRFEREVRATATLTHPNTVQIYDYGRAEDGTFYYAMEFLPGMTLEQLVGRFGPLPPARAIHLLRQVCGALCEAHAAGLVHRDIKPSNIVICERGGRRDVAKLLDFGLVLATGVRGSDGAPEGGIVGTPAYMAPEQAAGLELLDARADLYGLGAVGYFLLTGDPPFQREGLGRVLAAHRSEPATFPDRLAGALPADVKAVVLRCLEKDPARRYPDAGSVERALAACSCAESWTMDEADDWWRENAPDVCLHPDPTLPQTALVRDEDGP